MPIMSTTTTIVTHLFLLLLTSFVLLLLFDVVSFASAQNNDVSASAAASFSHLQRGNAYYGSGNLKRAAREYEACLEASSVAIDGSLSGGEGGVGVGVGGNESETIRGCLINLASVLVDMDEGSDDDDDDDDDDGENGDTAGTASDEGDSDRNLHRRRRRRRQNQKRRGRRSAAEDLYRRALMMDPTDGDASFNLALLLQDLKTDDAAREAASLYNVAIASDPYRWDAWANLASALAELGEEPLRAAGAYEKSILLIERGLDEAAEAEGEGRGGSARDPSWDVYLSKLYYGYGMQLADLTPEACAALASTPRSLLIGGGVEQRREASGGGGGGSGSGSVSGDADEESDSDSASASTSASYSELCVENALNALRASSVLDPRNAQAAHMLASIESTRSHGKEDDGKYPKQRRATPEFVAALFDDFADTFDAKLDALEYKVPRLIGAAAEEEMSAQRRGKSKFRSALDAGCGTGLAGRYLRHLVDGPLIGVDISRKMLDVAAECTIKTGCGARGGGEDEVVEGDDKKGYGEMDMDDLPLYDGLMQLDLETMTLSQTLGAPGVTRRKGTAYHDTDPNADDYGGGFDLVVAADVLVYFGGLDAVLSNFARLSSEGSTLLFSCERASEGETGGGWKMLSSGRFAHSKSYVVNTAGKAGYRLVGYEEIVPRMERGEEVKGHLFRFVKEGEHVGTKDEL